MKPVAICVGHSRAGDLGAYSVDGTSEWAYNSGVAADLCAILDERGIENVLIDRYWGGGYALSISWLADKIRDMDCQLALELHFNAAGGHAKGFEYLFWHTSPKGRAMAEKLNAAQELAIGKFPSRGAKPRTASHRGSLFLRQTHCPAVICEPFFGDNLDEWRYYSRRQNELATIYADAIESWL